MHAACERAGNAGIGTRDHSTPFERASALAGALALLAAVATVAVDASNDTVSAAAVAMVAGAGTGTGPSGTSGTGAGSAIASETLAGGYLGITHTHSSDVSIENPGRTSMTARDIAWEGKPFKSPIYYGLRLVRWA